MNKRITMILILVLAVSGLALLACGGVQEEQAGTTTEETAGQQMEQQAPPPEKTAGSGGCTWADMPLYPGAEKADQYYDGATTTAEEYTESHTFTTADDLGKVTGYYKAQMPAKGWQLDRWMDVEMTQPGWSCQRGMYSMRDGQDAAVVEITDKGKGLSHLALKVVRYE
jgi:hypothetical protein